MHWPQRWQQDLKLKKAKDKRLLDKVSRGLTSDQLLRATALKMDAEQKAVAKAKAKAKGHAKAKAKASPRAHLTSSSAGAPGQLTVAP